MKKWTFLLLLAGWATLAGAQTAAKTPNQADSLQKAMAAEKIAAAKKMAASTITFWTIKASAGTYGYSILINNQVHIWQSTIPGREGTDGFEKPAQAEQCARLVIRKIKQGNMLPAISEKELQNILAF